MSSSYNLLVLDGSSSSSTRARGLGARSSSTSSSSSQDLIVKSINDERDEILESGSTSRSGIALERLVVTEAIAQSVVELFRAFTSVIMDQQRLPQMMMPSSSLLSTTQSLPSYSRIMSQLVIRGCPPNHFLEYILETALAMDIFREIHLEGLTPEQEENDEQQHQLNGNHRQQQQPVDGDADHGPDSDVNVVEGNNGNANDHDDGDDEDHEDDNDNDTSAETSGALALHSFGFRMRFLKRLKTLDVISLPLCHEDVQGLMYGMCTSSADARAGTDSGEGLARLSFDGVRFILQQINAEDNRDDVYNDVNRNNSIENDDAVIEELCDGLPNITSLKILEMERCNLSDEHLSRILFCLNNHPHLTSINVAGNHCRQLGLQAVDSLLLLSDNGIGEQDSKSTNIEGRSRVESVNLGFQFTSEDDTFGMTYNEQMQLEILTSDWPNKINNILVHLNLSGNNLHDSDMKNIGLLLSRFPSLQSLDLSFNEITTDGLQMFVTTLVCNTADQRTSAGTTRASSSRLRSINLTNNPLTRENYASMLIQLLKYLPELRSVESNVVWDDDAGTVVNDDLANAAAAAAAAVDRGLHIQRKRSEVQHLIDINTAGRVLLCNSQRSISLSVWPLVLARLARHPKKIYDTGYVPMKNKCNGIYYLLRYGPVLTKPDGASDLPTATTNQSTTLGKRKRVDPALGDFETLASFLKAEADVATLELV